MTQVRTRFAPSPTGILHIGGARTALFGWLFAKKHGGQFIIRIEDTDTLRTIPGAMESQMADMRWLGLQWDEGPDIGGPYGPYIQSERAELYQKWAHWLVEQGHAYKCFVTEQELREMREAQIARGETPGYDRRHRNLPAEQAATWEAEGRPYVIRYKMPLDGQTIVPDLIRGDITFENSQLTDAVLLKASGLPTYHLAHVVDDHFMEITHVTRGDEWLNSGPLHIQLWQAFGWEIPVYAHMPVILSPSGKGKLSKRDQSFQEDGQTVLVRVDEFQKAGMLPAAVLNFLTNVGWSFGDDREIFSIAESLERFDLKDINPAPTQLPFSKMEWLNGQYIQALDTAVLAEAVRPFLEAEGYTVDMATLLAVLPPMKVRLKRLSEVVGWLRFLYVDEPLAVPTEKLVHKQMPLARAREAFAQTHAALASLEPFTAESLATTLTALGEQATETGKAGPYLGTLRLALTGQEVSPPLFESVVALGRERTLRRLAECIQALD